MAATSRNKVPLRVLFVGVDEGIVQAITGSLSEAGHGLAAERVVSCAQLRRLLRTGAWDIAFAALKARPCDAKRALNTIKCSEQAISVVVLGSPADTDEAIAAIRAGARDFVRVDSIGWVVPIVERELRTTQELAAHHRERAERAAEVHELSAKLRHGQKLHLLGAALGGIAHDFNNMLSVVMSYARAALEDFNPTSELREDLVEIVKASESAAELSHRLLGFVRTKVTEPPTSDVNVVITGMERMFRRVVGERIELALSLSPHLPTVRASPGQLEQILMNLVVNARDAMPQGGQLRIATSRAGSEAELGVSLVVSDSGMGMDASIQARIFEPFFTTKAEGKGTGLGLSTVLDIVRQNGGALQLTSKLGQGTTFDIFLPAGSDTGTFDESALTVHSRKHASGAGERVLLVEDDVRVRRCLQRILSRNGYSVSASSSAEEALKLATPRQKFFDLVICDVGLPGASGPELVAQFARRRRKAPALYISGHSDEILAKYGLDTSAAYLLRKPIRPEALIRKVRETIDRQRTGR